VGAVKGFCLAPRWEAAPLGLAAPVSVARVASFDEPLHLHDDDERRTQTLRELLQSLPGFIAGYDLREEATGRLMSVTLWESEAALEAGERRSATGQ
jgi:heme-degrading monooxygenase HmoA